MTAPNAFKLRRFHALVILQYGAEVARPCADQHHRDLWDAIGAEETALAARLWEE